MGFFDDIYNLFVMPIDEAINGVGKFIYDGGNKVYDIGNSIISNVVDFGGKIYKPIDDVITKPDQVIKNIATTVSDASGIVATQMGKNINSFWGGQSGTGVAGAIRGNVDGLFNTSWATAPVMLGGLAVAALLLLKI